MLLTFSSSVRIAKIIGIIIAVAAVFEIHMDKKTVTIITPAISFLWLHPIIIITNKAILIWRLQCSMAIAINKPPIKTIIVSFMYNLATSAELIISNKGNKNKGINDVIANGSNSRIQ